IVEHDELVGQVAIGVRRHLLSDFLHVAGELGIDVVRAALHLLRRHVVGFAELEFLLLGDEAEVALARHRIHHAGGNRKRQGKQQTGKETLHGCLRQKPCRRQLSGKQRDNDIPSFPELQPLSSTTLPDLPERITSKPFWNSSTLSSWVSTGEMSRPLCSMAI